MTVRSWYEVRKSVDNCLLSCIHTLIPLSTHTHYPIHAHPAESSVNLPKYQSRTKTLDGFLSKLRNRKPHGGAATVNAIPSAVARMKTSAPFTDREKIILDKYIKLFTLMIVLVVLIKGAVSFRGRYIIYLRIYYIFSNQI